MDILCLLSIPRCMRDGKGPQWPGRAEGATIRGNRQVLDEKIKYSSFAAKTGQTGPGERGGERRDDGGNKMQLLSRHYQPNCQF